MQHLNRTLLTADKIIYVQLETSISKDDILEATRTVMAQLNPNTQRVKIFLEENTIFNLPAFNCLIALQRRLMHLDIGIQINAESSNELVKYLELTKFDHLFEIIAA